MNPIMQMLVEQRIDDLHRAASHERVLRQAKAARPKRVPKNTRRNRRRQNAVAPVTT